MRESANETDLLAGSIVQFVQLVLLGLEGDLGGSASQLLNGTYSRRLQKHIREGKYRYYGNHELESAL